MKFFHPAAAFLLLAEPQIPLSITGNWFLGLLGALGCIYVVLGIWHLGSKVFGRRPPIDEDIRRLHAKLKEDLESQTNFLTRRIDEVKTTTEDLRVERERTSINLQKQISDLASRFSFLEGQITGKPHRR